MPGSRLSNVERNLKDFWRNPPRTFRLPLLRRLTVESGVDESDEGPRLRGIRDISVPLRFPVVALCGKNGVGKSTLLALAAISGQSPEGWNVFWGNTRPSRSRRRSSYTFRDFFPGSRDELEGLRLRWEYAIEGREIDFTRLYRGGKWSTVPDVGTQRNALVSVPERAIDFLPMSRVLPAGECSSVRGAFLRSDGAVDFQFNAESLNHLSFVMSRPYRSAEVRRIGALGLQGCSMDEAYTGFDMGGGECSVISLLWRISMLPIGGLMLLEEVELGLHPEAQKRLVEVLLKIASERRIQILMTTHSEVILDALPREARVLLRRSGGGHDAINAITTRFALHELTGSVIPELIIFVEDNFARTLVEQIAGDLIRRVQVVAIGTNVALAQQAVSHIRSGSALRALALFDGDCQEKQITNWIESARGHREDIEPTFSLLPGEGLAPEKWVLKVVSEEAAFHEEFARQFEVNGTEGRALIDDACVQPDHHSGCYALHRKTARDEEECARRLARSVRHHPSVDQLREVIRDNLG